MRPNVFPKHCRICNLILIKGQTWYRASDLLCKKHYNEKSKRYSQTPAGKKVRVNASLKAWDVHRYKWLARSKARNALKSGKIFKTPCYCGDLNVQGHHSDYSKPLKVVWLCAKHHAEVHSTIRYLQNYNAI